ncbi:MAG: energy transducer TonB [Pseudomonadota bacterium]
MSAALPHLPMLRQPASIPGLRSPLNAIIASVVIAHGVFLAWMNLAPKAAAPGRSQAQVVHLSLTKAKPTPAALPTSDSLPPPPDTLSAFIEPAESPPAPLVPEVSTPADPVPQEDPSTASAAVGTDTLEGSGSKNPSDDYLPRSLLTIAPRPSSTVIVPFPAQIQTPGRYTTILALFIDENGVVRRVRVEGPSLPQPLEEAATKTFMEAPFRPGERQGQAVKSLIRIEVVFDNTPLEPDSGPRSL